MKNILLITTCIVGIILIPQELLRYILYGGVLFVSSAYILAMILVFMHFHVKDAIKYICGVAVLSLSFSYFLGGYEGTMILFITHIIVSVGAYFLYKNRLS